MLLGATKRGAGVQTGPQDGEPKEQTVLLLFLDYRGKVPYKAASLRTREAADAGIFLIT